MAAYAQQSDVCLTAYEGELVRLSPEAYDPDPEIGPAGKLVWEFGPPFDNRGEWQTKKGQRGVFDFWVSVSDGELADTKHGCVELLPNNRDPVLGPVPEISITRGEHTRIEATCYDPDGDLVGISFRFQGKDVVYIIYEPPGTYDIEVICTDGFGGIDTEKTKLHILMPEIREKPKPRPAPAPVVVPPEPGEVELLLPSGPGEVELLLPSGPGEIEVRYPEECPPCPPDDDIDVVVYDSIYPMQDLQNMTGTLVIEEKIERKPVPGPAPKPASVSLLEESGCEKDLARKEEIDLMLLCC